MVVVAALLAKRRAIQRHYAMVTTATALDTLRGVVRMVGMVTAEHRQW